MNMDLAQWNWNVQSVKDSRNVTQDGQEDTDEELGTAASLEEDTERR